MAVLVETHAVAILPCRHVLRSFPHCPKANSRIAREKCATDGRASPTDADRASLGGSGVSAQEPAQGRVVVGRRVRGENGHRGGCQHGDQVRPFHNGPLSVYAGSSLQLLTDRPPAYPGSKAAACLVCAALSARRGPGVSQGADPPKAGRNPGLASIVGVLRPAAWQRSAQRSNCLLLPCGAPRGSPGPESEVHSRLRTAASRNQPR